MGQRTGAADSRSQGAAPLLAALSLSIWTRATAFLALPTPGPLPLGTLLRLVAGGAAAGATVAAAVAVLLTALRWAEGAWRENGGL